MNNDRKIIKRQEEINGGKNKETLRNDEERLTP